MAGMNMPTDMPAFTLGRAMEFGGDPFFLIGCLLALGLYGWAVVREPQGVTAMLSPGTFGHGGAFGTQGWIDPKQDLFAILLIQRTGIPNSDASPMRQALQELAAAAVKK